MAEPNSPQPPVSPVANRLTGQLVHVPAARPVRLPPTNWPPTDQPLPDAVAIRQIAIPQADPPYDLADDTATLDPPDLISAVEEAKPVKEAEPKRSEPAHFAEQYSAGPWPSQFAQALAEALAGTRPRSQLAPWVSAQARRRIRQLSPVLATTTQPKLRRVIITSPAGGVLEMTVVIGLGPRVRALAVRLERSDADTPADPATPTSAPANSRPANRTRPAPANSASDTFPGEPHWYCTAIEAA